MGVDYVAATIEVQFQMAPDTVCNSFTILEDTEVEPVETFEVLLETSDPAVRVTDMFSTVSINDSTGLYTITSIRVVTAQVSSCVVSCILITFSGC